MDKYIDREVMLQRQAKMDQQNLEDASEVSLDNDESNDLLERMSNRSGSNANARNSEIEERRNQQHMRKLLKNSMIICDPVTKWFVQYSLYLLVFSMALLSTTLPLAVTNVIMLGIMTVLVLRALSYDDQISFYKNSRLLLYLVKYGAFITIVCRYLAQFYLLYKTNERIVDPSLNGQQEG